MLCTERGALALCASMLMLVGACATREKIIREEIYVPQVMLTDADRQRYADDVDQCRTQVFSEYKDKHDIRNINTDFRACLLRKGYVLLS